MIVLLVVLGFWGVVASFCADSPEMAATLATLTAVGVWVWKTK